MKVQATLERLAAYQSNGLSLYATPTADGEKIADTYWASSPKFQDDYIVAEVSDFQEAMGYSATEITPEEAEELGDDVYELEINPAIDLDAVEF